MWRLWLIHYESTLKMSWILFSWNTINQTVADFKTTAYLQTEMKVKDRIALPVTKEHWKVFFGCLFVCFIRVVMFEQWLEDISSICFLQWNFHNCDNRVKYLSVKIMLSIYKQGWYSNKH